MTSSLELAPAPASLAVRLCRLNVASVSTLFPSAERPQQGIFVERRLNSLSRIANVRVVQPVPWFPLIRPRCTAPLPQNRTADQRTPVSREPMFYLPGVLKSLDALWLERSILPVLRSWNEEHRIDLIDAHFGYPEGVGCVRAAHRLGLPVFVTLRGNEVKHLERRSIKAQLLTALKSCTGIITVSDSLRRALVRQGIKDAQIAVIPNAVDMREFHPGSQAEARSRLNLPADRRFLIAVGHLVHEKGHDLVIRALAHLRIQHPEVELIILGARANEPAYPRRLHRLAAELGLTNAVHFVGGQSPQRVAAWLQAADVFTLATWREGCCNAVLEALACGLPVVTTSVGDNEQYVSSPHFGSIVPPGDWQSLSRALHTALGRNWNAHEISQSIARRGGWEGVASQVARFFEAQLQLTAV